MIRIPNNLIKFIAIAFLGIHLSGVAQQVFNKTKQNNEIILNYTWSDNLEISRDITFTLPASQLNFKNHKKFIPELAQQYVYIELLKAERKIDPREARVKIQRRGQEIFIQVNSRSDKLLDTWQRSMQQSKVKALDQYLKDNYYSHFRTYLGQEAIKPDHLRYIKENQAALLPIAQTLYDTLTNNSESRTYVNLVLSWVQSIPYNELRNRVTSNGAGYLPPLAVVAENQGDCDSKSVLMASLIRSLLPEVKMIMLFLPNHALLGISLPVRSNEETLNFDGSNYLLLEPTGPAKFPLGEIANSSARDIAGNMYSVEVVQ